MGITSVHGHVDFETSNTDHPMRLRKGESGVIPAAATLVHAHLEDATVFCTTTRALSAHRT
jgi:hypothetical protein